MEKFQKKFMQALMAEYDQLSEREKAGGGLETRKLAAALFSELEIRPSFVESADYHGSDAFLRIYNTTKELDELGLIKASSRVSGFAWLAPTPYGRDEMEKITRDEASPDVQGKRIVEYVYNLQQHLSLVQRKVGKGGQISLDSLMSDLAIDLEMYRKGAGWAQRQGYIKEPSIDQFTIDNGGVYITDEGMSAIDNGFQPANVPVGQSIHIHDNTVAGDILAAGRDAMTITSPEISASATEIRQLLEEVQSAIDALGEDEDDDRHDGLQEIESLQREFSKEAPSARRIERSLTALGSLASISALAGPHLARLIELAQQLPG